MKEAEEIWIGIDPSLRGTGLVAIGKDDEIVFMTRIAPHPKEYKDEELLDECYGAAAAWFNFAIGQHNIKNIAMERIAYGGSSGTKDKIAAGWWRIRQALKDQLKMKYQTFDWPPNIVACNTWRKHIITKADRDLNKEEPDKLFLKKCPYSKLPETVRAAIDKYCEDLPKHSEYDLGDAYWLAYYSKYFC